LGGCPCWAVAPVTLLARGCNIHAFMQRDLTFSLPIYHEISRVALRFHNQRCCRTRSASITSLQLSEECSLIHPRRKHRWRDQGCSTGCSLVGVSSPISNVQRPTPPVSGHYIYCLHNLRSQTCPNVSQRTATVYFLSRNNINTNNLIAQLDPLSQLNSNRKTSSSSQRCAISRKHIT
jgi:hypothetical protein